MNITVENADNKTLISLKEERIDAHNSLELKDFLQKLLENGQHLLIVDLAAVRFIDSSGLGALLSGYKNANLRQGSLILTGLQPRVHSMFELTRLHRVFEIYSSLDEALAASREVNAHGANRH
ncbi:MAG: STAS domain-containing protein [Methylococcaceae bacterium]|nr:STAS domain-containing protein [Methylococcaceae bacterium]